MRRLAVVIATAASLVAVASADAASTSSNWAGYAASGASARFRRVSATWTVAPVSCTAGRRSYSALWIGLGGYHTNARALEQAGTDANCDAAGGAHYSAWYELVPAASVRLGLTVHAGDTISASVGVTGARVRDRAREPHDRREGGPHVDGLGGGRDVGRMDRGGAVGVLVAGLHRAAPGRLRHRRLHERPRDVGRRATPARSPTPPGTPRRSA